MRTIPLIALNFVVLALSSALLHAQTDYVAQGEDYLEQKAYQRALESFSMAIAEKQQVEVAYVKRGVAYYELGEWEFALFDFEEAIRLDSSLMEAYVSRAHVQFELGEVEAACRDCSQALLLDSLSAEAHLCLAECTRLMAGTEKAVAILDSVPPTVATISKVQQIKGNWLLELGRYEAAFTTFKQAVKLGPAPEQIHACYNSTGYTAICLARYEDAVAWLLRAIGVDPSHAFAPNNLTFAELKLGRLDSAAHHVQQSIELMPDNSYAYRNRALIFHAQNQIAKACEDWQKALQLEHDPNDPDAVILREACH